MEILKEIVKLQDGYKSLVDSKKVTKKTLCDLCCPFRDKYELTDSQTLRLARNEMSLKEIVNLFDKEN